MVTLVTRSPSAIAMGQDLEMAGFVLRLLVPRATFPALFVTVA